MSEETKRDKFVIQVDEPFDFGAVADTKYTTSNELCIQISELFRNVFADFEGCKFIMTGQIPTISLFFNHGEYGEGATVACERASNKTVGSSVIDRSRFRDRLLKDGDRYYLTDDGKDVVKDLVLRNYVNNGNVNFGSIVSERAEGQNSYFATNTVQYTEVAYLDAERVCGLLFGSTDKDGNEVAYKIIVPGALNSNNGPQQPNGQKPDYNYMLNITRISSKELADFCKKVGITGFNGLGIIR